MTEVIMRYSGSGEDMHDLTRVGELVRCKDCKHRNNYDACPMTHVECVEYDDDGYIEMDDILHDYTQDDGFCHKAERKDI